MKRAVAFLMAAAMSMSAMAGDLTQRYELTLHRVLEGGPPTYTQEFVLADAVPQHTRRFTNFSGDVSGRYIEALSAVARESGRDFASLHRVVDGVLKLQKADGHFGDAFSPAGAAISNSDMALLWGNGRLLVGLMEYQRLTKREDVLACARRLGDFLVAAAPRLNTDAVQKQFSDNRIAVGYICWTQTIEGLVQLAKATGDVRYRALAEQIAEQTAYYPAGHSHGYVTALRGILELYDLTGEKKWLEEVEAGWRKIVEEGNVTIFGALPEAFKPLVHRDEGCSEADWLRLNLGLWRRTGQAKYLEAAETTLFNEFAYNEFSTGDFGHHTFTTSGVGTPTARAWWCCTFHGLRAFPEVRAAAFRREGEGIAYGLPVDGEIDADGVTLRAESSLERDGTVTIEVVKADGKAHGLAVRVPAWAQRVTATAEGSHAEAAGGGGNVWLSRNWAKGDRVTIAYELRTRVVQEGGKGKRVAFFRGPWLLGVGDQKTPAYFDEPSSENRIAAGAEAMADGAAEAGEPGAFLIPAGRCRLEFLPGGYPMQPQRALLRPIAEQTGSSDTTTWEFWFTPKD